MRPQRATRQLWPSLLLLSMLAAVPASAQVNVLTQHNDNGRSGANLNETVLTPGNVKANIFGKLFSVPVDGHVYAQILYVSGLAIAAGKHNVIYVATEHNTVYAFDADTGVNYWHTNLGPSIPDADLPTNNMPVEIGITSTPVIDLASQTLYCVPNTEEDGKFLYHLHALDIVTGQEKLGGPTLIQASVPGTGDGSVNGVLTLDGFQQNQRPGLLLSNGTLYIAFASHQDRSPYHGWVLAYDAATLRQTGVFNDTPDGGLGGIWQAGQGLTADASGNVYLMTGNGTTTAQDGGNDYGEAFLKLALSPGSSSGNGFGLTLKDWFVPNNYDDLNAADDDLGSAGILGIPCTKLIVGGGKEGKLYLIDTDHLGHENDGADPVLQEFQAVHSRGDTGHIHGSPIYWNGPTGPHIYVWGENDRARAFAFHPASGKASAYFDTTADSVGPDYSPAQTQAFGMPGGFLSLSANGAKNGIIWATTPYDGNANEAIVHGVLRAYDARDLKKDLWNTKQVPARDDLGLFAKYNPPTVANGKVYLPTFSHQVCVYGLLPAPGAPTNLTAQGADAGAFLHWTSAAYASTYDIYRGTAPGQESATPIAVNVKGAIYTDLGLNNGTKYYYKLVAVNGLGQSAPSNEVSATPSASLVKIISLRFNGGGSNGTSADMAPAEVAGVIPAASWNNASGAFGELDQLLDDNHRPTGVSVNWSADETGSLPIKETAGNARMMKGYLDADINFSDDANVTINNLPSTFTTNGYDVYVYADGDNGSNTRLGAYFCGGTQQNITDAAGVNFNGTFHQAASGGNGNYTVFRNQTASTFQVFAFAGPSSDEDSSATINAIEIVAHPHP